MNYPQHDEWDQERPGMGAHRHHRPHGPRPMGGPGFGPGFGFGPGGRRGGRNRRGQVRESILALLVDQPRNGYQIIQALEERTQGLWRPSPGAVYPALNQLEDEGLIESFDNDGQKGFRLTEAGRKAAAEVEAPWEAVNARFGGRSPESMQALWQELGSLAGATKELVRSATPDQVDQAVSVIAEARRRIYGLLAADPDSGPTTNPDDLR